MSRLAKHVLRDGALIAAAVALLVWGLGRMRRAPEVATVTYTTGQVQCDDGQAQHWQDVAPGAPILIGEAVRTGPRASAKLRLIDGGALNLEPDSTVRFLSSAPGKASLRIVGGAASVDSHDRAVTVETALGLLSLDEHSAVRVHMRQDGADLQVDVGQARFVDRAQVERQLGAGQRMSAAAPVAAAPVAPAPAPVRAQEAPKAPEAPLVSESAPPAASEPPPLPPVAQPAPGNKRAHLTLRAGENATIHSLGRDTRVLISSERCSDRELVVELARGNKRFAARGRGTGTALIHVGAGTTRYRVRCTHADKGASRVVASGAIHLLRDAAVRRVPQRPPSNTVLLDGRRYTLLYQNRLPAVTLEPKTLAQGRFVIKSGSRLRTLEAPLGTLALSSGELRDGTHQVFFERNGEDTRTPVTTIRIMFDNAAPAASLDQSGALDRDAAGKVQLSGVVPLGSKVSIAGTPLSLDGAGRFVARTAPREGAEAVALRVEHPRTGLHYIVRNLTGPSP